MMTLKILLFAAAREACDRDQIELEMADGATIETLIGALKEGYPNLTPILEASRIAVNHAFASNDHALHATDEIAVIPPVSGG